MSIKRLLSAVAGILLAVLAVCGPASPVARAATPPECDGVWVVVQTDEVDPSSIKVRCATKYGTGLVALRSAGFDVKAGKGMVTQIEALPDNTDFGTNGGFYWSYWHTTMSKDGALAQWEYYTTAADTSKPAKGIIEGWLLTNREDATGPTITQLNEAIPATTPASASPSATQVETTSDAPPPSAAPQTTSDNSPVGAIVAGVIVVAALLGLGGWWLVRGRRR